MKAHLAKLSLALLSAAFLLAYQEQGSGPVGPEGPQFDKKGSGTCAAAESGGHCHGDSDNQEGPNVDVTLEGGIISDGAQPATLSSDGGRVSAFNGATVAFFATLALTAPDDLSVCQHENTTAGLTDYLTKVLGGPENELNNDGEFTTRFQFSVQRKKGSGKFTVNWRQPTDQSDPGRWIRVQLSSDNVISVDQNFDETEFTFQPGGGAEVSVRRSAPDGQPVNSRGLLTCPYLGPDLVVLLDRSPS